VARPTDCVKKNWNLVAEFYAEDLLRFMSE